MADTFVFDLEGDDDVVGSVDGYDYNALNAELAAQGLSGFIMASAVGEVMDVDEAPEGKRSRRLGGDGYPITCMRCGKPGSRKNWLEIHHITPHADGGDDNTPLAIVCRRCHLLIHQERGDFARWGRAGGTTTVRKYGRRYMQALGSKGADARWQKEREKQEQLFVGRLI